MNNADVSDAFDEVCSLLEEWYQGEEEEQEVREEIARLEENARKLASLRGGRKLVPWQKERLKLLKSHEKTDQSRLAELKAKQQGHQKVKDRLHPRVRTLCCFAGVVGIDADPLRRLFDLYELDSKRDAIATLIRIEDAIAVSKEKERRAVMHAGQSVSELDSGDPTAPDPSPSAGGEDKASFPMSGGVKRQPRIYYLGDRMYRVDESEPIIVSSRHDCILRAFIGRRVLELPELEKLSGFSKDEGLTTSLKRLCDGYKGLFKHAIVRPGKRGPGYCAEVIGARSDEAKRHYQNEC